MIDQTAYWVGLSMVPGIGPARMRSLLNFFGDAETAYTALFADLLEAGLDGKTAEAALATRRTLDLEAEMEKLEQAGASAVTWESDRYPQRLREVDDAPPVLYVLGEI